MKIIAKVKDSLRDTFIYDIHTHIKYKMYPYRLRKAGVVASYPQECAVSDRLLDGKRVIVSLTSFPARIPSIKGCLCSLMNQEYKPNKIILWLAESQFPNKERDIPTDVLSLQEFGLEIRWVERDIRSYKKLVPALEAFPEDIIVTADDDLYYPKDWLKKLVDAYREDPSNIHCHLVTRVSIEGSEIRPQLKERERFAGTVSFCNQILGVSGSLFPPHSLFRDVTRSDIFMQLAPTNDDVWFWAMAVMQGTKIHYLPNGLTMEGLIYIEGSQENTPCLTSVNIDSKGEMLIDKARTAICEKYELIRIIKENERKG